MSWESASAGIPAKVSIGLGGLASSEKSLGILTKENGVFLYDFSKNMWINLPTDPSIIAGNPGALQLYKEGIYVGTQYKGVYHSNNNGKTWTTLNHGLGNLTIRRFQEFENKLYICTNDGFYSLNREENNWEKEFGENDLQTNGAAVFNGSMYIATNKGVFKNNKNSKWNNLLPNHSVHNIGTGNGKIFAMTYNALLLSSSSDGMSWQNEQEGLPANLYTFTIIDNKETLFAGQWDGVYSKTKDQFKWQRSGIGLPMKSAVTNIQVFKDILVINTQVSKQYQDQRIPGF